MNLFAKNISLYFSKKVMYKLKIKNYINIKSVNIRNINERSEDSKIIQYPHQYQV